MVAPLPPRRSLQARLTLHYAVGILAAGAVVIAVVALSVAGVGSTTPVGSPSRGGITGAGNGVGPRDLLVGSLAALVVLVPAALGGGWYVAGRFLRPLRDITATASAISAGNLHRRLALGEPVDELSELGGVLDDLFARLEASFVAQRHFVANASHELRTPLAGLRTVLEVALADPGADADALRAACHEALALGAHQERLLQSLLDLATSERGATRWDTLDLGALVRGVLGSRRDHAALQGIELAEHLSPAVTSGDRRLIESLVANLIDNAIHHNHRGGHVEVTTRAAAAEVTLQVVNSGPVVAADQVERLLQPFQRLARDRGGAGDGYGLGLAIVDAVARAHHGRLTIDTPPGGGLAITVRFPSRGTDLPGD